MEVKNIQTQCHKHYGQYKHRDIRLVPAGPGKEKGKRRAGSGARSRAGRGAGSRAEATGSKAARLQG